MDVMKTRRSCRAFSDEMPGRELLEAVCEAGTYAPTGHGRQSPLIVAVTRRDVRDRLSRMNAAIWRRLGGHEGLPDDFDPFYGAPVILLVLADRTVPTWLYDGCAVLTNMANAAHAVGLDTCWIHRAAEEFESAEGKALLRELGIEGDYAGVDHLAIGFRSRELAGPRPRKDGYVRWVE